MSLSSSRVVVDLTRLHECLDDLGKLPRTPQIGECLNNLPNLWEEFRIEPMGEYDGKLHLAILPSQNLHTAIRDAQRRADGLPPIYGPDPDSEPPEPAPKRRGRGKWRT